jgi:hypothetical protein
MIKVKAIVMTFEKRGKYYSQLSKSKSVKSCLELYNVLVCESDPAMKKYVIKCLHQQYGTISAEELIISLKRLLKNVSITVEFIQKAEDWHLLK